MPPRTPRRRCVVVAGVERTQGKKVFAINVENRNEETLQNVVERYVLPGSIICIDGWKAYKNTCLNNNFEHQIVNHSKFFKDPDTGVHTNRIEGSNNTLKYVIKPRNKNKKHQISFIIFFMEENKQKRHVVWIFKSFEGN
ncbi:hypothetical protein H312_03074 [Anncaliia algerae PRA339]|uniref:ISXO2-like transposase domain-containing protein n=1 Tax=Anncaliia algerae PRA339 TaxID=1288291 RepID=A0A059EWY9_9MICR|nr:hypothetical protein H312_03074 [Anncaliia algerae PRA339]